MKLILFLRCNALKLMPQCKASLKCASTLAEQEESTLSKLHLRNKKRVYVDFKSRQRLQKLLNSKGSCSICSIAIPLNYVGWAKISIPDLVLQDWDSCLLPDNFLKIQEDTNISSLAKTIKQNIPDADSYVLENKKLYKASINELNFRAMLMLLLSSNEDSLVNNKVLIQHTSVLNSTHNLVFYNERKPTMPIVSSILNLKESESIGNYSDHAYPYWYSKLKVNERHRHYFRKSERDKQECLSLALLVALSFLRNNYFEAQTFTEGV